MKPLGTPLLTMEGVRLSFSGREVLRKVDLSLHVGEVLVILGLSGSGKSTLLRLILGLLPVDSGSIRFKDSEITKLSRSKLNEVRMQLGMVYQDAALISSMSVRDNLSLPLQELTKKTPGEIKAIVEQKLEMVGLKEVMDKQPSELSGGMAKRVGLARALVLDPELILFDEPTAGLDPINSGLIDQLIVNLRKDRPVAAIVVTHEMQSAFTVATRMTMLNEGVISEDLAPEEFSKSTDPFVRQFLKPYLSHASS